MKTTAGQLNEGDRVLWFDSPTGQMKSYVVMEHTVTGGRIRGRVRMKVKRYKESRRWAGPASAEVGVPTAEDERRRPL